MNRIKIEIKWGIIFTIVAILWMFLEKSIGLHDKYIDKQAIFSNFFAVPAIVIFVIALIEKRNKFYNRKMTWKQGFISGLIISVVVTIFSPLVQFITTEIISPDYFNNVIEFSVNTGKLTKEVAEKHFNLSNYIAMSAISGFLTGVVTSAIVSIFVKRK